MHSCILHANVFFHASSTACAVYDEYLLKFTKIQSQDNNNNKKNIKPFYTRVC